MERELQRILFESHPEWFELGPQPLKAQEFKGFECGDGWYLIIQKLLTEIEKVVGTDPLFAINEVRERGGGLRVYTAGVDGKDAKVVWELIDMAEEESLEVCEICGGEGKMVGGFHPRVRCEKCKEMKKYE